MSDEDNNLTGQPVEPEALASPSEGVQPEAATTVAEAPAEPAQAEPQAAPAHFLIADSALLAWVEDHVRTNPAFTRDTGAWNEINAAVARIRAAIASTKGVQ